MHKKPLVRSQVGEKLMLTALAGQPYERPPIWLMRQAGRYLPEYRDLRAEAGSFLNLCLTPGFAAEATLQPLRRFPLDAAILFADLPLPALALGQDLSYRDGEGPVLPPIRDRVGVSKLHMARFHEVLAPVYETVRLVRQKLPPDRALIGFAGAPWTLATYMVEGGGSTDHAHTKRFAYGDPAGFSALIDLLVEATGDYLIAQIEAGADIVQIFDSWASSLPDYGFSRWCLDPIRKITARIKAAYPLVPIIAFPRGIGFFYEGFAAATGVDAVSLDTGVSLAAAAKLKEETVIQGNLDPQLLVTGGRAMKEATDQIMARLSGENYIFNLGHGIVPQTPVEHVTALVSQILTWRK